MWHSKWQELVMLKIDIHTHILPPQIPKFKELFGYGGFIELRCQTGCSHVDMYDDSGKFFRRVEPNCLDHKTRLEECDHHGVQVQVLSTVPVMFSYWTKPQDGLKVAQFLNDHIAGICRQYPKRFIGLGTVPLQDIDLAIAEARRCKEELGFSGLQIGSHINGLNLSEKTLFPFYQACEDLGLALFIHPWEMMGEKSMQKYWLPWLVGMPAETSRAICSMIFGGVFEKFPNLRVAFAHGGGSFPSTLGRIQHGFNVRPDLCAVDNPISPREYLGKFFVDSLTHDVETLRQIVKLFGENRVCLGTDYPFPLGDLEFGKHIEMAFSEQKAREALFHGAALEWLNLDKKLFL
jgi:aminocarboxymuconate-semialdehyde decarboxylase